MNGFGGKQPTVAGVQGLSGSGGGILDIAQLAALLKPYFVPASQSTPPGASPTATGNRRILLGAGSAQPSFSTSIALDGGTPASLTWTFPQMFASPPIVTATFVGAPSSGTPELWVEATTTNTVTVRASAGDTRFVNIVAVGALASN